MATSEILAGRTKGKQFTSAASRRGQTGSNWSSIDRRLDAESPVNALGEADHARSQSHLAKSASARTLGASSSALKPWVPNNPGAKSTGAGSFQGTFRGKPFKYIAPEVELKGPPPKLLHNPPQLLASGSRRGGPGTATRELSSFPYESDAHPWPSKPPRPELAPRSFLAGKPRETTQQYSDKSLYSLDGFRPPLRRRSDQDAHRKSAPALRTQ